MECVISIIVSSTPFSDQKGAQLQIFIHLFRGSLATETGLVGFNESI